jgi:hypothetical protein
VLSAEYGWTTDYILTRTLREIHWRLGAIARRTRSRRQDYSRFHAAIHGIRLPGPVEQASPDAEPVPDLTEAQRGAMDRAKQDALARIQARHRPG